uniref:Uncharacterized protein n=1 Tax=Odontella aurita TaxID=265563 RepID=A0A7S4HTL1_9STRA|mmetsp:Transcript_14849/g.43301  ORF Transcript_14849/g.43301 Transcript_14849/m.43301 type:complete len:100 (+) Transcript_14849:150-449(+)
MTLAIVVRELPSGRPSSIMDAAPRIAFKRLRDVAAELSAPAASRDGIGGVLTRLVDVDDEGIRHVEGKCRGNDDFNPGAGKIDDATAAADAAALTVVVV